MSRRFRRHKLAGRLTVLGDHERVPLLQKLHGPPETTARRGRADHLPHSRRTELRVASSPADHPSVSSHFRMDVVEEIDVQFELQGAEPG